MAANSPYRQAASSSNVNGGEVERACVHVSLWSPTRPRVSFLASLSLTLSTYSMGLMASDWRVWKGLSLVLGPLQGLPACQSQAVTVSTELVSCAPWVTFITRREGSFSKPVTTVIHHRAQETCASSSIGMDTSAKNAGQKHHPWPCGAAHSLGALGARR